MNNISVKEIFVILFKVWQKINLFYSRDFGWMNSYNYFKLYYIYYLLVISFKRFNRKENIKIQ